MKINIPLVSFIFQILILSVASSFENAALEAAGEFAQMVVVGLLVISLILLINNPIKFDAVIILIFLYFLLCLIGFAWSTNLIRTSIHSLQILSILNLLILLKNQPNNKISSFYYASIIYLIFTTLHWIADGVPISFAGMYSHRNTNGSHLMFISFFFIAHFIAEKRYKLLAIYLIPLCILLIFIASRSTWISAFAIICTYFVWNFFMESRAKRLLYIASVLTSISIFIIVYLYIATSANSSLINQIIMEYTGRQLFSGREDIWPLILDLVKSRWVLGYGPGTIPDDFTDLSQNANSAHNLYIQTLFQTGLIGLLILVISFVIIWMTFTKDNTSIIRRLAAAFFIGILIHQLFEVTLTQNKFSMGLIQWFIIGTGLYIKPDKK